jgi:competence protein ComEA
MFSRIQLISRRRWLLLFALPPALVGLALVALFAFFPSPQAPAAVVPPAPSPPAGSSAPETDALPPPGGLMVSVSGAVAHPGLYRVAKGERVYAAIAAAGGMTDDADRNRIPNLAARLRDGQEVKVPVRGAAASRASSSPGSSRPAAVSLNHATADELAAVPGFTSDLAAAAVRYRQEYGGFSSTRELVTVLGMGEADYLSARRYLTV